MDQFLDLLNMGIRMSAPIMLCVLGGIFPHKAGVLNIAMDGMMIIGAFASVFFISLTQNVLLSIFLAVLASILLGAVFSIFSIFLKGNKIIVGLAVNMFAMSIVPFLLTTLYKNRTSLIVTDIVNPVNYQLNVPLLNKIPILSDVLNFQTPLTYLAIVMIYVMWIVMYRTKFGVYVRVVGENEEAAKAVGINVISIRFFAIVISAVMAGLAGANLSVENLGMFTLGMVAFRGYIALAAIRCGKGEPVLATMFTLIFGIARALQIKLTLLVDSATASLVELIPYVFILIAMFITSMVDRRKIHIRGYMYDK